MTTPKKSSTPKKSVTVQPATVQPTHAPGSAIAALMSAISPKTTDSVVGAEYERKMRDPAIVGAVRKGKSSSVVTLGSDPSVSKDAKAIADIKSRMDDLAADFKVKQEVLRTYGSQKRELYNDVFRTDITTVNIPYSVEVPPADDSSTPGYETKFVQVTCANKYTVAKDPILEGRETVLGKWFDTLFVKDTKKVLRQNAEDLFRQILIDQGLVDDVLEKAMSALFEEEVSVATVEAYESLEKTAPDHVRQFLSQSVTRNQPSIKFP